MFRLRSFIHDAFRPSLQFIVMLFALGVAAFVLGLREVARAVMRPRLAPAFACIFAVVTLVALSASAFADDAVTAVAAAAAPSLVTTVLGIIAAALPGVLIGGWALFKSYAAHSEATWDDWTVAAVEKTCRGVLEKSGWTLTPPPAGPAKSP